MLVQYCRAPSPCTVIKTLSKVGPSASAKADGPSRHKVVETSLIASLDYRLHAVLAWLRRRSFIVAAGRAAMQWHALGETLPSAAEVEIWGHHAMQN